MKVLLAKAASDLVAAGLTPQLAADRAVALLGDRTQGKGGLIVVDAAGRMGFAFSTSHMALAYLHSELSEPVVHV
jgi:beta-aspartyl-peptidase (threonine type)